MLKFKKKFNNVSSLIKSYEFIYYACIFMYVVIVIMLLGFGLYFHNNSVAVLDTSTQEDLTVAVVVTKEFSPVLVQEELAPLAKDTFTSLDRSWIDWG